MEPVNYFSAHIVEKSSGKISKSLGKENRSEYQRLNTTQSKLSICLPQKVYPFNYNAIGKIA